MKFFMRELGLPSVRKENGASGVFPGPTRQQFTVRQPVPAGGF